MNALKHAFPSEKMKGRINIAYDVDGTNWKLSVADNGICKSDGVFAQSKTGLGTGIIKALAQELNASVETLSGPDGTIVSITHATFCNNCNPSCLKSGKRVRFGSFASFWSFLTDVGFASESYHISRPAGRSNVAQLGHDARLMPAKCVRLYLKGQKND